MKIKNVPVVDYEIIEATGNFVYGRISHQDMMEIEGDIEDEVERLDAFDEGEVGNDETDEEGQAVYEDIRKGGIAWLEKSKYAKAAVRALVEKINARYFDLDISTKPPEHQYTVYQDLNDHYDWHQDFYEDEPDEDFRRTLSLSLCLSADDFYEGAEFFIKDGSETNVRVFKMRYGDFIIFPAETEHRVNALRSGVRCSLVVWFGHKPPTGKGFK